MRLPFVSAIIRSTPYKSGYHPIFISISYRRERAFISLEDSVLKHHWDAAHEECYKYKKDTVDGTLTPNYLAINATISTYKNEAETIINDLRAKSKRSNNRELDITATELKNLILAVMKPDTLPAKVEPTNDLLFFAYGEKLMGDMLRRGEIGNYKRYKTALNKFGEYLNDHCPKVVSGDHNSLLFSQLTRMLLENFQTHLQGFNQQNTVYSTLKVIKAIYKKARKDANHEYLLSTANVFEVVEVKRGKDGFKDKLTLVEMASIISVDLSQQPEVEKARDIFVFQFLSEGKRIADILTLTWRQVKGEEISFVERKTGKTKSVSIDPLMRKILDKYSGRGKFVFDFIKENLANDELAIYNAINSSTTIINRNLKKLKALLEIDIKISTHIARHTYSLEFYDQVRDVKQTQDMLNHSRSEITDQYLATGGVDVNKEKRKEAKSAILEKMFRAI